jgi:hypothetical protein
MAQINPRTFADAKQLADGVYELILTNWGNRGQAQDPDNGSISYPPVKNLPGTSTAFLPKGAIPIVPSNGDFLLPPIPSLSGIAIAPRSDVDKCILNFPALPQQPAENTQTAVGQGGTLDGATGKSITIPQGFVNYGGELETEQELSVHAPLIGQLNGPILIRAHWTSYFDDSYTPIEPGGTSKFGTQLNALPNNAGPGFFKTPELRLLLYLTSSGVLPPRERAPYYDAGVLKPFYPAGGAPPIVYPCMGRRAIRVNARNFNNVPVRLRVEGVWPKERANFGSSIAYIGNTTELELITIPAAGSGTLKIDYPGTPFLTLTALDGPIFGSSIHYQIAMFD